MHPMHRCLKPECTAWIIILAMLLLITACAAVGPDYTPPDVITPDRWTGVSDGGAGSAGSDPARFECWWDQFNDPILTRLIERAIAEGLDIRQALARLRGARAKSDISGAALYPTLDLSADATWRRSGNHAIAESFGAAFDAGWELDLFGGLRRAREAAAADLAASEMDLLDVMVSLTAEVGINYVTLCIDQTRLAVAEANLDVQQETFDLVQGRLAVGLGNELDLLQARYNLESTRSRIPGLITSIAEARRRLAVLSGGTPGSIDGLLAERQPVPRPPAAIAVGIPAETLQRRPDIRRAERELAAQTARIGVAEADRYPSIRLSGTIGLEAGKLGDLFDSAAPFWSHGPRITLPIFDAGARRQAVEVQTALQAQALAAYQTAVLQALEEVENAVTAYAQEQVRRSRLASAVEAAAAAERLSRNKYAAGLIDFSDVLDVQRTLLAYQDQLAESDGTVTANLIRLYKALGGGWSKAMLHQKDRIP